MIPLTTMPPSEENTPPYYPRRRPVDHGSGLGGYGSALPYGHLQQHPQYPHQHQHQQLVVRGSPRHPYGQYTTAAQHEYFVRRQPGHHVEQASNTLSKTLFTSKDLLSHKDQDDKDKDLGVKDQEQYHGQRLR